MFLVATCKFSSRGLGLRHCGRGGRRPAGAACALRALAAKKLSGLVSSFSHWSGCTISVRYRWWAVHIRAHKTAPRLHF